MAHQVVKENVLEAFFLLADKDPRVGPMHIVLFVGLYRLWKIKGGPALLLVFSKEGMNACKIYSRTTYSRLLNDLACFGLITYQPSYDRNKGSQVRLSCPKSPSGF